MSYDFDRFSPQSFERFVQSMACARFGSGVQVYGAGGDGAREATFEGRCSPDEGKTTWDGYVVVQAKYMTEPKNTKQDLAWLVKQLDKDLVKFLDKRRNLRTPDYYVIATNVSLTAGAENAEGKRGGSLDSFREHLAGWSKTIGFKDFYVWERNVLTRLLDLEPEPRKTFSSWTTPGEVLTHILSTLALPDYQTVIGRLIRDELRESRNLNTRDAGHSQSRPIFIEEVFVDLPLSPQAFMLTEDVDDSDDQYRSFHDGDEPEEGDYIDPDGGSNLNVVNALMERSADILTPSLSASDDASRRPLASRVVILGGPGQGKSTIGQFLAQLTRSRFLLALGNAAPDLREIATAVVARGTTEGIFNKGPLRLRTALLGIRVAMNDIDDMDIDEAAGVLAAVPTRAPAIVLRRLYRAARKDRAVDDLIVAAALRFIGGGHRARAVSGLMAEVLSSRASRLIDTDLARGLRLPEAVHIAIDD